MHSESPFESFCCVFPGSMRSPNTHMVDSPPRPVVRSFHNARAEALIDQLTTSVLATLQVFANTWRHGRHHGGHHGPWTKKKPPWTASKDQAFGGPFARLVRTWTGDTQGQAAKQKGGSLL